MKNIGLIILIGLVTTIANASDIDGIWVAGSIRDSTSGFCSIEEVDEDRFLVIYHDHDWNRFFSEIGFVSEDDVIYLPRENISIVLNRTNDYTTRLILELEIYPGRYSRSGESQVGHPLFFQKVETLDVDAVPPYESLDVKERVRSWMND